MSNVADLLKDVTGSDSKAIGIAGDAIGALADLGGAAGVVTGLIDLFVSHNDDLIAALSNIESQIKQDFAALQAEQRAEHLLDKWNNLDPALAQAQTVLDQLKDDLSKDPPVTQEYRLQQIGLCLDAVNQLNQDDKWLTNYADEIYYGSGGTDYWTGEIAPAQNPDGTVFSDRYILPDFLRVLYVFMLVAAAFEPDYPVRYKDSLQRFTARLQTALNTSSAGIVTIRTPTRTEVGVGPTGGGYSVTYGGYLQADPGWMSPFVSPADVAALGEPASWLAQSYFQEYGVVHTYSGYSSISYFPSIPKPNVSTDVFWVDFTARLNLATRRNWKSTYVAIGLAKVWDTINALLTLTGDSPQGGANPGTSWSLKETNLIMGSAFRDPFTPAPSQTSAFDTISRLAAAGGLPTARPLSWRGALSASLTAATITPAPEPPPAPIGAQ